MTHPTPSRPAGTSRGVRAAVWTFAIVEVAVIFGALLLGR